MSVNGYVGNETYLSINGPKTAGPSSAIHGATADIRRASPLSRPTDNMCSGRNGNMQPTPTEHKHKSIDTVDRST